VSRSAELHRQSNMNIAITGATGVIGRHAAVVNLLTHIPPALEPVARSQRASSRRLREVTGWKPRVRGGTEGWRLIVAEGVAA
jgi:aspartate-semialdehyde dehydrogenase